MSCVSWNGGWNTPRLIRTAAGYQVLPTCDKAGQGEIGPMTCLGTGGAHERTDSGIRLAARRCDSVDVGTAELRLVDPDGFPGCGGLRIDWQLPDPASNGARRRCDQPQRAARSGNCVPSGQK